MSETRKRKRSKAQPMVSAAGVNDLREVARIIARIGSSRAVFMKAIRAVFAPLTPAERRWLYRAWEEANTKPEGRTP